MASSRLHSPIRHREVKYMKNTWWVKYYLEIDIDACRGTSLDALIIHILIYSKFMVLAVHWFDLW